MWLIDIICFHLNSVDIELDVDVVFSAEKRRGVKEED